MKENLLLLALLWALWCTLHSLLASSAVTACLRRHLGSHSAWFRLLYNFFALLTIGPLLLWLRTLPYGPVLKWEGPWWWLRGLLYGLAAWLLLSGAKAYPLGEFLGISQIRQRPGRGAAPPGQGLPLVKKGVLGMVRHPWYLAVLILLWARDLAPQDIVTGAMLSLYVLIGAWLEEKKLLGEFGEEFRQYRKDVPMFLPWKWAVRRLVRFFRTLAGQ